MSEAYESKIDVIDIASIGIDFDNTIVCYESIFQDLAVKKKWIHSKRKLSKHEVKDKIYNLENGIIKWKTLQSIVYSDLISNAIPKQGVFEFIKKCNIYDINVYIVSHKTEYAEIPTSGNSLRVMALEWLSNNLEQHKVELPQDNVYFANTREEKIDVIKSLNCNYFVDDLVEVLSHSFFPHDTQKILLTECVYDDLYNQEIVIKKNWNEIEKYVFS